MNQERKEIVGLVKIIVDGKLVKEYQRKMRLIPGEEGELKYFIIGNNGNSIHPKVYYSALKIKRHRRKHIKMVIDLGKYNSQTLKSTNKIVY